MTRPGRLEARQEHRPACAAGRRRVAGPPRALPQDRIVCVRVAGPLPELRIPLNFVPSCPGSAPSPAPPHHKVSNAPPPPRLLRRLDPDRNVWVSTPPPEDFPRLVRKVPVPLPSFFRRTIPWKGPRGPQRSPFDSPGGLNSGLTCRLKASRKGRGGARGGAGGRTELWGACIACALT